MAIKISACIKKHQQNCFFTWRLVDPLLIYTHIYIYIYIMYVYIYMNVYIYIYISIYNL